MTESTSSMAVFDGWAAERQAMKGRARLSAASAAQYRMIWSAWLRYLASVPAAPGDATPAHVQQFLSRIESAGVEPGPALAHRAGAAIARRRAVSSVTHARYLRLLEKVYRWAVAQDLVQTNPVRLEPGQARPSERSTGLALHEAQWLRVAATASAWPELRERAMLMLLVHVGLTAGELVALNLQSVRHPRLTFSPSGAQLAPAGSTREVAVALHVSGARDSQERELDLPEAVGEAVLAYLAVRLNKQGLTLAGSPLFLSQKSGQSHGAPADRGRLRRQSVFVLVKGLVATALGEFHYHNGPAVLRNSAIARWLRGGMDEQAVLHLAGLKSPQALRRLRAHTT